MTFPLESSVSYGVEIKTTSFTDSADGFSFSAPEPVHPAARTRAKQIIKIREYFVIPLHITITQPNLKPEIRF